MMMENGRLKKETEGRNTHEIIYYNIHCVKEKIYTVPITVQNYQSRTTIAVQYAVHVT